MPFPQYVDLEPFDPCNLKCPFCFGPDFVGNRVRPLPISFWREVLVELRRRDVRGVVVSGGEPTLYRGEEDGRKYSIIDLLREAKRVGLRVTLSSNTTKPDLLEDAVEYVDWLAIPIDSSTVDGQLAMRGFARTLEEWEQLIARLRVRNPGLKIKLGTVATDQNQDDIVDLAKQISRGALSIDTWKVYQYHPRRMTLTRGRVADLAIPDEVFRTLRGRAFSYFSLDESAGRIVWSSIADRAAAYLFVYSDGSVVIPNLGSAPDVKVGSLSDTGFSVFDAVPEIVDGLVEAGAFAAQTNAVNYETTYGG